MLANDNLVVILDWHRVAPVQREMPLEGASGRHGCPSRQLTGGRVAELDYLRAIGFTGDPTAPVIRSGGATTWHSKTPS